jgi:hypothetical protein
VLPRRLPLLQGEPQHLDARAVVDDQLAGGRQVGRRAELQDDREVVGQLVLGDLDAGPAIGLLELDERDATTPGVAVGEVRQEEAAPAGVVEGLDEGALQVLQGLGGQLVEERRERHTDWLGKPAHHAPQQRHPLH